MKIGVVGLGLIGGSIYKDLMRLNYDVVAVSQSQKGENIFKSYDVLKDCSLVFVCSPMNKTLEILDELQNILFQDTVVTDVCSLKRFVCQNEYSYNFIPSHPMAGTEHKGFENSFEGLFKGATWVLTPTKDHQDCSLLVEIVEKLGAKPLFTTPEKHDESGDF